MLILSYLSLAHRILVN